MGAQFQIPLVIIRQIEYVRDGGFIQEFCGFRVGIACGADIKFTIKEKIKISQGSISIQK